MMNIQSLPEQLRSKIQVENECWLWTAATQNYGYGVVNLRQAPGVWRTRRVHRVVFEMLVGEIPHGLELDHLCRVPACCNPDHLEPVTHQENVRRGLGPVVAKAKFAAPRDCPSGHPLEGDNLYAYQMKNGYINRQCRTCRREGKRRRRAAGKRG